jgi:hypothetical protein
MVAVENFRGLGECDAVLLFILAGLFWVPFEYQHGG